MDKFLFAVLFLKHKIDIKSHIIYFVEMSNIQPIVRSMIEKHPLANDGSNFISWQLKLNIVLKFEKLSHILDGEIPKLNEKATDSEREAKAKWEDQENQVHGLMLASMGDSLQAKYLDSKPKKTMEALTKMFMDSARKERYKTTIALTRCHMAEGTSVSMHFLTMQGYLEKLSKLSSPMPDDIAEDLILGSLAPSYKDFIMHYHVREKGVSLEELHNALKTAEVDMGKGRDKHVLAVHGGSKKITKGKGKFTKNTSIKSKGVGGAHGSASRGKSLKSPTPNTECFHCGEKGHIRPNCPKYKEDLDNGVIERKHPKKAKGIFVIEINLATSVHDWVIDTGSCAHIISNVQLLKDRKELVKNEMILKVGNGASVAAIAQGSVELQLSSGLNLCLKNVYYVHSISKNIISVSCLDMDNFNINISNSCLSISKNGIFYANAFVRNGLYLLELNNKQILNINNKRLKLLT